MDDVASAKELSDQALLERVRAGVAAAAAWPAEVFDALNKRDFIDRLIEMPEVRTFAIAISELTMREERVEPRVRNALISLVHPLPPSLKPASAFFARLGPELTRLRELDILWRASEEARKHARSNKVARISIVCLEKDVQRVRDFVRQMNRESKFDEVVPKRPVGRPPKPGTAAARRREESARAAEEILEPTEAEIASATKPMNAP